MEELITTPRLKDAYGPRHTHNQVAAHEREREQVRRDEVSADDRTMTLVTKVMRRHTNEVVVSDFVE